ncbi:unnamed protein product [marine sediment metagenome]|uniref:Uncharacterized protein n=1 Tax=marine sediment metagenome TaxID=412755 RepID=X1LYZ1_9ZZZZ
MDFRGRIEVTTKGVFPFLNQLGIDDKKGKQQPVNGDYGYFFAVDISKTSLVLNEYRE